MIKGTLKYKGSSILYRTFLHLVVLYLDASIVGAYINKRLSIYGAFNNIQASSEHH